MNWEGERWQVSLRVSTSQQTTVRDGLRHREETDWIKVQESKDGCTVKEEIIEGLPTVLEFSKCSGVFLSRWKLIQNHDIFPTVIEQKNVPWKNG